MRNHVFPSAVTWKLGQVRYSFDQGNSLVFTPEAALELATLMREAAYKAQEGVVRYGR